MAREGIPWVLGGFTATVLLLIFAQRFALDPLRYLGWGFALLTILIAHFYRDPRRDPPQGRFLIVSPADGKVLEIERDILENIYLQGQAWRVSLALSLWAVHINRIPLSGEIELIKHVPGSFWPAFSRRAPRKNEHNLVGIRAPEGKVLVKQMAGSLARRIVCRLQPKQSVSRGQKFGMIQLGSRVDLFVPSGVELKVKRGDRLVGGETIVGVFR
ncbi:phosphatidylserine decarboxylase [Candidatus Zixiibacteriota bacterium]